MGKQNTLIRILEQLLYKERKQYLCFLACRNKDGYDLLIATYENDARGERVEKIGRKALEFVESSEIV